MTGWVPGDAPAWAVGPARKYDMVEWAIACFGKAPAEAVGPIACWKHSEPPTRIWTNLPEGTEIR